MNYWDKIEFATLIIAMGLKQGYQLEWCKDKVEDELWKPALSLAFNGLFGKVCEGEA